MEAAQPDTGELTLDGPIERARFSPGLTVVLGLIAGFILFQGISLVALLLVLVAAGDLSSLAGMDPGTLVEKYAAEFLLANTVGQVFGLLLLGWLFARLHTRKQAAFLRIRGADPVLTILSVIGLLALIPIVQWLGTLMEAVPWPEWIQTFEQVQLELIERVLASDLSVVLTFATMALTPAICEEVFFRGYIQRQTERATGRWFSAILITGILFGIYHLRITQALPLSVLGVYLSYVVWRSNSLLPGVLVHLTNNGLAVALGAWIAMRDDVSAADLETMEVPVYILISAVVILVVIVRAMHVRGERMAHVVQTVGSADG